jgi:hypothetical protein
MLYGAESKDPEDAYLAYAVRSFSTIEARVQDLAAGPTFMVTGTSFYAL